ncbi:hypothetical protein GF402_04450 [Candidatus Fermentibacteria bacterium]|nr:hypothetical protein [Candidatus Fermentibacteria bacterium]
MLTLVIMQMIVTLVLPDTLHTSVNFQTDDLSFQEVEGWDYVKLSGASPIVREGYPSLPRVSLVFVIPAGSTVGDVSGTISGDPEELDGEYSIWPTQPQVPITWDDSIPTADPDSVVYNLDSYWPDVACIGYEMGRIDGIELAIVDVFPVTWNPSTGKIRLAPEVNIALEVVEDSIPANDPIRITNVNYARRIAEISRLLANPEVLQDFSVEPIVIPEDSLDTSGFPELTDCLIITNTDWEDQWQPLVDWNNARGIYTETITLDVIDAGAGVPGLWEEGRDWAETIRNCFRWCHENEGVKYFLIGADSPPPPEPEVSRETDVPARFCDDNRPKTPPEVSWFPTDWYYSCLDAFANWNTNNNDKWGQYNPYVIEENDLMDLLPDVVVGRMPVHSSTEVEKVVLRVIEYQHHEYHASDPDPKLDLLLCSASADESGFPCTTFRLLQIYETLPDSDYPDTVWLAEEKAEDLLTRFVVISKQAVLDHLQYRLEEPYEGGPYRVNFGGHGGNNYLAANPSGSGPGGGDTYKVLPDELRSITGVDGVFATAWAFNCGTGDYAAESNETICETWLGCDECVTNAPLGPCYIGNTRSGWNSKDPLGSSSHRLNGWFVDEIYNQTTEPGCWGVGETVNIAKIRYGSVYIPDYNQIYQIPIEEKYDHEPMWDLKSINVIGDPCCPLWLTTPTEVDVQHPGIFYCPGIFEVTVIGVSNEPIEGARVCLMLEGATGYEVYARGFTDANGVYSEYLDPENGGQMQVTVTKQNILPYEGTAVLHP